MCQLLVNHRKTKYTVFKLEEYALVWIFVGLSLLPFGDFAYDLIFIFLGVVFFSSLYNVYFLSITCFVFYAFVL